MLTWPRVLPKVLLRETVFQGFRSYRLSFLVIKKQPGFFPPLNSNKNSFRTWENSEVVYFWKKGECIVLNQLSQLKKRIKTQIRRQIKAIWTIWSAAPWAGENSSNLPLKTKWTHPTTSTTYQLGLTAMPHSWWIFAPYFIFKSLLNPEQHNLLENNSCHNLVKGCLLGTGLLQMAEAHTKRFQSVHIDTYCNKNSLLPEHTSFFNRTSLTHLPSVSRDIVHSKREGGNRRLSCGKALSTKQATEMFIWIKQPTLSKDVWDQNWGVVFIWGS